MREYWGTGNAIVVPLLAVMAVAFTVVGVFFGPAWFKVAPEEAQLLRWCFVAGGIGLFFSFYSQFWLILSQTYLDFKFLGVLRTAMGLLQVIPAIVLAWATGNPLVLIAWSTATAALQLGIFVLHGRKAYGLGLGLEERKWERAREMAAYTAKTFAALVTNRCSAPSIAWCSAGSPQPLLFRTTISAPMPARGFKASARR